MNIDLMLADAVLSGGATLVAGSGGLPQRITTADNMVYTLPDIPGGTLLTHQFIALDDVNGLVAVGTAIQFLKLAVFNPDGTVRWKITPAGSGCFGVLIDSAARELYAASIVYGPPWATTVSVYDVDTGVFKRSWVGPIVAGDSYLVLGGSAPNDIWMSAHESDVIATLWRLDGNDGTILKVINMSAAGSPGWLTSIAADATYVYTTSWVSPCWRFNKTTGAGVLIQQGGGGTTGLATLGATTQYRNIATYGGFGYLLGYNGVACDEFTNSMATATRRVLYPGELPGQLPGFLNYGSDYAWGLAINANTIAFRNNVNDIKLISRKNQRAHFTYTFTGATTLERILIPGFGDYCKSSTYDDSRSKAYYSFDNLGTLTPVTPSTPLNIPVIAGTKIEVVVDMNLFASPVGIPPYIGGDSGEGVTLVIPDADSGSLNLWGRRANMTEWVDSAGAVLSVNGGADGYITVADVLPFYPGALAWLSNDNGSQLVEITEVISASNKMGIRFMPEKGTDPRAAGTKAGNALNYGRNDCSAYTTALHARIDMEAQAVRVQAPFHAFPKF